MSWLVPESQRELTPYRYHEGKRPASVGPVEVVVIHWTASPAADYDVRRGANEHRLREWLAGRGGRNSTHIVVLRDGLALQGAPLTDRCWHAGQSSWALGAAAGEGPSAVNGRSIGIDLENVGPLERRALGHVDTYGGRYLGPMPSQVGGSPHEPFTRPQVEALLGLIPDIVAAFPVLADGRRWVGHRDVAPGRKVDPGPAFPWRLLRASVNAAARGECLDPARLDWLREKGVCA